MKGIWKAIAYFVLYFGLTMILQVLLSIVFCAIGAANGLHDETLIMEFANNNIRDDCNFGHTDCIDSVFCF